MRQVWGCQQHQQRHFYHTQHLTMMPEGPEVKAAVDDLRMGIGRKLRTITFVSGRYTVKAPVGYNDTFSQWRPSVIADWNCKGKFIYLVLEDDDDKELRNEKNSGQLPGDDDYQKSIWITLGMTGRFLSEMAVAAGDNRYIRWYMELEKNDTLTKVYYADMRNFGTIKFVESRKELLDKLEKKLGPDILEASTDDAESRFLATCNKYEHWNVCKLLMDQSKLSGVGNYILAESLYRSRIDPFAPVSSLSLDTRKRLFTEVRLVAKESYQSLVHNTTSDFEYQVYGREVTNNGDPVHRETKGPHGRTIWYTDQQIDSQLVNPSIPGTGRSNGGKAGELHVQSTVGAADFESDQQATMEPLKPRASGSGMTRGNIKLASILSEMSAATETANKQQAAVNSGKHKGLAVTLLGTIKEPGWKAALQDRLPDLEEFQKIANFLETEYQLGETIFPPQKEIFAALNLCPLEKLKVVIVGQDPYHGRGQGHGLAFSVQKNVRAPPSLQNIFRELVDSVGIESPTHGNLHYWAQQGVLLLNSVLTVKEGQACSHARKGWEEVTNSIIREACERQQHGLVFLLWGNAAAEKVATLVDVDRHTIIRTSHPSPLGATKTKQPFLGSNCFNRANQALIAAGLDPVDWSVGE